MKSITRRLRVLRAERGLSQRETALQSGVQFARYQRIEAGYQMPSAADVIALAKVFQLAPGQVLEDLMEVHS